MFFQAFYIQLSNIKRNVFKYLNFLVINYIFYRNDSFGLKGNLGKKRFFSIYFLAKKNFKNTFEIKNVLDFSQADGVRHLRGAAW